jgi:hypothetical protein
MLKYRKEREYEYQIYDDQKIIAYIFEGGDDHWRIFNSKHLAIEGLDEPYPDFETAFNAFSSRQHE